MGRDKKPTRTYEVTVQYDIEATEAPSIRSERDAWRESTLLYPGFVKVKKLAVKLIKK